MKSNPPEFFISMLYKSSLSIKSEVFIAVKSSILTYQTFEKMWSSIFTTETLITCVIWDLHSCFYHLYRNLRISFVLNRPLCYNLYYSKILYAIYKKKSAAQTTEWNNVLFILTMKGKKGEKNNQILPSIIALCEIQEHILPYLQHGDTLHRFQITWPNQEKLGQNWAAVSSSALPRDIVQASEAPMSQVKDAPFAEFLFFTDLI